MHLAVGSHFFTSLPVVGPQAPQFQSLGSRAALRNRFRLADSFRALDATRATTSSHIEQRMFLLSTNLPQYHFHDASSTSQLTHIMAIIFVEFEPRASSKRHLTAINAQLGKPAYKSNNGYQASSKVIHRTTRTVDRTF